MPFIRAIVALVVVLSIYATFYFTSQGNINGGLISTIFATSLIFTIIFFYFKYDQQVTVRDIIGSLLIIVCIVLIGIGATLKQQEKEEEEKKVAVDEKKDEDYTFNLIMSILFAVATGALFTLNTVTIQWAIHLGCDIDQANYDSYLIMTFMCLPFFLYELEVNETPYTVDDALISATIIWIMALCV